MQVPAVGSVGVHADRRARAEDSTGIAAMGRVEVHMGSLLGRVVEVHMGSLLGGWAGGGSHGVPAGRLGGGAVGVSFTWGGWGFTCPFVGRLGVSLSLP